MDKMKQVAKAEVKAHEKRMHKMAKGGVTSMQMKQMGLLLWIIYLIVYYFLYTI